MKIVALKPDPKSYSCTPYLILGSWNAIEDINTLIDPGPDGNTVISQISKINTGLGKRQVDQIVFTHNHYDHAGSAKELKKAFNCRLCGNFQADFIDEKLADGQTIRAGDEEFEVFHTPYHSDDSICLYCRRHGVIFTGDTTVRLQRNEKSFSEGYRNFIRWLARARVKAVYSGHDPPLIEELDWVLANSLEIINQSFD